MSEEVYSSGDEILVIDEHGITPYKILRVVKREFKLLTKYYYELQYSHGEIKWISSLDLKNKTVVRITPENTCGARNPPQENLPKKTPINIGDLDLNKLDSSIKSTLDEKIKPKSLTGETVCEKAWFYNHHNLWFIETKIGNYISIKFAENSLIVFLVKTPATLEDLDILSKNRVNHAYYYTTVAGIFGNNFKVIG